MRHLIALLSVLLAISLVATADARRPAAKAKAARKQKKAKPIVVTKQTKIGIEGLMGKFKWGMSSSEVIKLLQERIRKEEEPVVQASKDPLEQDRLRKELEEKVKRVKDDRVDFMGKVTPWDVSLVDKEFAHRNNESMVVSWEKAERRFYFFFHDRLWKIYVAFNAELFEDKTFEDFAQAMETRFGPAERLFSLNLKGEQVMDHMSWPPFGKTRLLAYDYTSFFGNFCLSLVNLAEWESVASARKANSPQRRYNDPLVKSVTIEQESANATDDNEDVVDRITGQTLSKPAGGGDEGTSNKKDKKPGKGKKVDTKNPVNDLDI